MLDYITTPINTEKEDRGDPDLMTNRRVEEDQKTISSKVDRTRVQCILLPPRGIPHTLGVKP